MLLLDKQSSEIAFFPVFLGSTEFFFSVLYNFIMNLTMFLMNHLKLLGNISMRSDFAGPGDKPHFKVTNSYNDTSHFSSNSPGQGFQKCPEELSANLEHLGLDAINNLSSLLVNLLPSQDVSSGDSDFVQSTALDKLLLLKDDLLKSLEKTECEIDLFENELKSIDLNCAPDVPCTTPSESRQIIAVLKPCQEQADPALNLSTREHLPCNDPLAVQAEVKEEIYIPGTVPSKHSDLPSMDDRTTSDILKLDASAADFDSTKSVAPGEHCSAPFVSVEASAAIGDGEDGNRFNQSSASTHVSSVVSLYCEPDSSLSRLIFASNKELAREALEVFDKFLPSKQPQIGTGETTSSITCRKNHMHIQEKLYMHKHFQKFKELVLTFKFRAFHHLWKEDMRLLSLRKNRAKPQKRFELSCRSSHSAHQKHRSSIRSRHTSPGEFFF